MLLSCVVENRPQKVKLRLISIKCLNLVVLLHTLHCHSKPDRAKISQTKNATRNEQIDERHYDCRLITRHQTHYITGLQSTWQKRESTDVLKIYVVCFEDGKRGRVHQSANAGGVLALLRRGNECEHSSVFHAWIMLRLPIYVLNILFNFCLQWQLILQYEYKI